MLDAAPLPPLPEPTGRTALRAAVSSASAVAAAFCVLVAAITLAAHVRLVKTDPLNSPALLEPLREFSREPGSGAMKERIRTEDLRVRRAYFANQEQIARGGTLLLCGALILLIGLAAIPLLRDNEPDVSRLGPPPSEWERRRAIRRGVAAGAGILAAAVLLAAAFESVKPAPSLETLNDGPELSIPNQEP